MTIKDLPLTQNDKNTMPRREVLEAKLRTIIKRRAKLDEDYEFELAQLEQDETDINQKLQWHSFSQARKKLWATVQELPTQSGIYEIWINDNVVYVGESINIRSRCEDHLKCAWNIGTADVMQLAKLYIRLASTEPDNIKFTVHKIDILDKKDRLAIESNLIEKRKAQNHPIANVTFKYGSTCPTPLVTRAKANRKKVIKTEEEWEALLSYMSSEIRSLHYIRDFK